MKLDEVLDQDSDGEQEEAEKKLTEE